MHRPVPRQVVRATARSRCATRPCGNGWVRRRALHPRRGHGPGVDGRGMQSAAEGSSGGRRGRMVVSAQPCRAVAAGSRPRTVGLVPAACGVAAAERRLLRCARRRRSSRCLCRLLRVRRLFDALEAGRTPERLLLGLRVVLVDGGSTWRRAHLKSALHARAGANNLLIARHQPGFHRGDVLPARRRRGLRWIKVLLRARIRRRPAVTTREAGADRSRRCRCAGRAEARCAGRMLDLGRRGERAVALRRRPVQV
mmetsp:Transcript_64731/g.180115  ORF Transcript_64731/g.180115 Transcript_64731/m.180115 type:complete len:254 (-) Transcript_64731:1042-1803(-)